jgi:FkbM family methyltransferase
VRKHRDLDEMMVGERSTLTGRLRRLLSRVRARIRGPAPQVLRIRRQIRIPTATIAEGRMDGGVISEWFVTATNREQPVVIISAGIGDQINFELDLLTRLAGLGVRAELYAVDPTPKSLEFLATQELPKNFHVIPYALSGRDGEISFSLPRDPRWVSGSEVDLAEDSRDLDRENRITVAGKTLKSMMTELKLERVDLLKIDIEGSEFSALENILADGIPIEEMLIDVHHFLMADGDRLLTHMLNDLERSGFRIFEAEEDKTFSCINQGAMDRRESNVGG